MNENHLLFWFFSAPELLTNQLYSNPVDFWSLGVTLAELLTGKVKEYFSSFTVSL